MSPTTSAHDSQAEETCRVCDAPALHKVAEVPDDPALFPLSAYLCCEDFGTVMGPTARLRCAKPAAAPAKAKFSDKLSRLLSGFRAGRRTPGRTAA